MSKELAFTDDNDVVKYLDTTTAFNLALTADGVAFDLTNAKSILVKIANDDGYIMQETIDLTTVTSPLGGTISFPINQDIMNTLVPDDYDIEVWVTMNDGTQAIFPSDGTLGFSIEDNLMSDTGEVIPIITLNDFQQQFNDLSSQMANAVQNVQKGDQGNPGNGIKSANNQYQLSDSPVTVPTGGWSDTILATTDQLPYLWTKIIFTYDDGTTKETNFVSSRGDTGSQGPIGPVGPQGKQGNGLVVRGKADKEENLPTTGNNQGDGYLVGTDLYIWIDGSWQNMGSITPDLADYVKVADMNNALNAKQDKIGYTPADDSKVVHTADTSNWQKQAMFNPGDFKIDTTSPTTDFATLLRSKYNKAGVVYIRDNDYPSLASIVDAVVICEGGGWWYAYGVTSDSNGNFVHRRINPIYDTGWVINADDSKVAHLSGANNFDTVPTVNNNPLLLASSLPSDLARTGQDTNFTRKLQKSGIDVATTSDVSKATTAANAYTDSKIKSSSDTGWQTFPLTIKDVNSPKYQAVHYRIINNILYFSGNIKITSYSLNNSQMIGTIPDSIFNKLPTFSLNDSNDQRIQLPVSYYWFSGDAKNSLDIWINNSKQIKVAVSSTSDDDSSTGMIDINGISIPLN